MNWGRERYEKKPRLIRALRRYVRPHYVHIFSYLYRTFGTRFILAGIPKLLADILGFIAPLVMQRIIYWLESDEPMWIGYTCAAAMFLAPFLQSVFSNLYFINTIKTGMRVRGCLYRITRPTNTSSQVRTVIISSVYRKSLRLSGPSRQKKTQGEIVNMQSNDAQRLMDLCPNFHLIWSAPLQIIAALYLLYTALGSAALVGVGLMIMLIPLQGFIAARLGRLRKQLLFHTDHRVKIINEIIQGIRCAMSAFVAVWRLTFGH